MAYNKAYLVATMSRVQNGQKLTPEEIRILHEQKAEYNGLGGDSYVDDMFEKCEREHLI